MYAVEIRVRTRAANNSILHDVLAVWVNVELGLIEIKGQILCMTDRDAINTSSRLPITKDRSEMGHLYPIKAR